MTGDTAQIWLHIGSPKTGTTSLQGFLNDNQDYLRDNAGLNYVTAGRVNIAHNRLATQARIGEAQPIFDKIVEEVDAAPRMRHVISSEMLFNLYTTRKFVQAVPEAMRGGRTRVICYLRRQDAYLEALYKQLLKNGRIAPDRAAFLADSRRMLSYDLVLNAYAEVFGADNIELRPFSRDRLAQGDVVADFAAQLGFEITPEMQQNTGFANKTFSAEMSETLATLATETKFNIREVIREISALDAQGLIRSHDVYTRAERLALMDSVQDATAEIIARYMPDDADFFDYADLRGADHRGDLTPEDRLADRLAATQAVMTAIGKLQDRDAQVTAPAEITPDAPDDRPPSWYEEIYPAGPCDGWYRKFGDHSASFVTRDRTQLVVSFDNLHQAGDTRFAREPWAQKFCADRGFSHLGIYAQTASWFRDTRLIAELEALRDAGFFAGFERVAFVGTSMGAFGALTFSSLAPGSTVVAFSPQTTLDPELVPWENRFAKGRAADWSLPYSDAALHTSEAKRVYLIYDPFHIRDRKHVIRLDGANLTHLKGFGLGHKSALLLNRMGVLKEVMAGGIAGTLEPQAFYKAIRARKNVYLYRTTMEHHLSNRGQQDRRMKFVDAFIRRRRALLAS